MTSDEPVQPTQAWRERQAAKLRKRFFAGMIPGLLVAWGIWIAHQFFGFDPFSHGDQPAKPRGAGDGIAIFAIVLIMTALALLIAWWWVRRMTDLYQNGIAVPAQVVKRVIAAGGIVRLRCGYDVGGKQYTKDHPFPAHDAEQHERGKPILMFVSQKNPRRAIVAVSFDE